MEDPSVSCYDFQFIFETESIFFKINMLGWKRALWTGGVRCIFEIPEFDPRSRESGTDTRLVAKDGEGRVRSIGVDAVRVTVRTPQLLRHDITDAHQRARAAALSATSKVLAMFAVQHGHKWLRVSEQGIRQIGDTKIIDESGQEITWSVRDVVEHGKENLTSVDKVACETYFDFLESGENHGLSIQLLAEAQYLCGTYGQIDLRQAVLLGALACEVGAKSWLENLCVNHSGAYMNSLSADDHRRSTCLIGFARLFAESRFAKKTLKRLRVLKPSFDTETLRRTLGCCTIQLL